MPYTLAITYSNSYIIPYPPGLVKTTMIVPIGQLLNIWNHRSIINPKEVLGNEDVDTTTATAGLISSNENILPTKHPGKVPNIQMGSNSISSGAPGLVETTMIVPIGQLLQPPSSLIFGNINILPNTISSRNHRSIKNPEEVLGNEDVDTTTATAGLISRNENILPNKHPDKVPNIQMGSNSISLGAPGLVNLLIFWKAWSTLIMNFFKYVFIPTINTPIIQLLMMKSQEEMKRLVSMTKHDKNTNFQSSSRSWKSSQNGN